MHAIIYVDSLKCSVYPRLPVEHYKEVRKRMSFTLPGFEYTPQHKKYGWDGTICLFNKQQVASAGCCYRLQRLLDKLGYNTEIVFETKVTIEKQKPFVHDLILLPFQQKAAERALKYRYGIIQAPVRAGKTAIMGAIINQLPDRNAWVVTNGVDLVNQTRLALEDHCKRQIGYFSESEYEPGSVVVTSYQALGKVFGQNKNKTFVRGRIQNFSEKILQRNKDIEQDLKHVTLLILDECHHAYARRSEDYLNKFSRIAFKIGLSGTPRKNKLTVKSDEAKIGPILFNVAIRTLIKNKRLAKPLFYIFNLPIEWYSNFLSKYVDEYNVNIVQNTIRNCFIRDLTAKLNNKNKTVFIMVSKIEHGETLQELIPGSMFVQGIVKSEDRKEIYSLVQKKQLRCIIGTVGKEGLNIPSLDVVINAEGLKGRVTTVQKMRSLTATEGKKYGVIVDFVDHGPHLKKQSKARIAIYQEIKGAEFKTIKIKKDYYQLEGSRWLLKG